MKNLMIVFVLLVQSIVYSAPKAVYDSQWDKFDNSNKSIIDHKDFDVFLKKYVESVKGVNLVNYKGVTTTDKALLNGYIEKLEKLSILSYSKNEQRAYWVNLYNALTIKVILDTYPVKSILNSYGGLLKTGPWDKKLLVIEGKKVSLNDIEHRILRPLWKDSRVYFLVNCASIGCPNLLLKAITDSTYEEVADMAAKQFINSLRGIRVEGEKLVLSSIFDWYRVDFGKNQTDLLNYLRKYVNNKQIFNNKSKISYDYDWNLNEQ